MRSTPGSGPLRKKSRSNNALDYTDDERYDAAQWYFYKWLAAAELGDVPKLPFREPEPGEI